MVIWYRMDRACFSVISARLRYFCSPHHQDSALYPFKSQLDHRRRPSTGGVCLVCSSTDLTRHISR
jgi:hypothetical protein